MAGVVFMSAVALAVWVALAWSAVWWVAARPIVRGIDPNRERDEED